MNYPSELVTTTLRSVISSLGIHSGQRAPVMSLGRRVPSKKTIRSCAFILTSFSDQFRLESGRVSGRACRPLKAIIRRLSKLLSESRRVEAELLAHIGEVDARKLFAREACSSMFVYCTEVLHLSEAEAYLRIAVARAARRHPLLLEMLGDGRLHLSGIAKLAPHLTDFNRDQLLAGAAHQSKRQIEELLAELEPKPDGAPGSYR